MTSTAKPPAQNLESVSIAAFLRQLLSLFVSNATFSAPAVPAFQRGAHTVLSHSSAMPSAPMLPGLSCASGRTFQSLETSWFLLRLGGFLRLLLCVGGSWVSVLSWCPCRCHSLINDQYFMFLFCAFPCNCGNSVSKCCCYCFRLYPPPVSTPSVSSSACVTC